MSKRKNVLKILLYLLILLVIGYLIFTARELGIWKKKA